MVGGVGLTHPNQFRRFHFHKRMGDGKVKSFMDIYTPLKNGELIEGTEDTRFRRAWDRARSDSFAAAG